MSNNEQKIKEAISAYKAGNRSRAQYLLFEVVRADSRNETAWLWLSVCVQNPERKIYCLKRVLSLNPDNENAKKALAQLKESPQPFIVDIVPTAETKGRTTQFVPANSSQQKSTNQALIILAATLLVFCGICSLPFLITSVDSSMREIGLLPTRTPTSTPNPTNTPPPPTATVDPEIAIADWGNVDIRELAKNPDRYLYHQVHYRGEVFAIEETNLGTVMQVWVTVPGGTRANREAIIMILEGKRADIYRGDIVEVWGYGLGSIEGTNAFGGRIQQPAITVEHISWHTPFRP